MNQTMERTVSLEEIEKFKNDFIRESPKTFFGKKKLKMNASKCVCDNFDLFDLLNKTAFIMMDETTGKMTNKIYIDYLVFKLYANPENYEKIIEHVLCVFDVLTNEHQSFEIHLNLKTFTVSSAERYKFFIEMFAKECLKSGTKYSNKISKMYVLNTPSVVDFISKMFNNWVDPCLRERIVFMK